MRRWAINCLRKIAYTLRQPTPYSLGFIILVTCQYALYTRTRTTRYTVCVHFGCHFGRCPGLTSSVAPVASAVRTLLQILGSRPEEIRLAATHHLKVSPFESARAHICARPPTPRGWRAGARGRRAPAATPHLEATSHLDRCTLHWPPLRAPQQAANASDQRR